jgi:lipoprotein-anchoring transpeptidase ErfK/SrfK
MARLRLRRLAALLAGTLLVSAGGGSAALASRALVTSPFDYAPGTLVISKSQKRLYLQLAGGEAIQYPIAVGMAGKAWLGWARIEAKYVEPAWSPPAEVKRDHPEIPNLIPGGAPNNPMGPRALLLTRSEIAIHGTTRSMRKSIGTAASYGCIRMYNEDVVDLYQRVAVGEPVIAVP